MENLGRFEWWIPLTSHGVGHAVMTMSRFYQWFLYKPFFPCISRSLQHLASQTWVSFWCSIRTSISEMSLATLKGQRSTVLVKNVIQINGGACNCSPVWSKKWLLNKRCLKLPSHILWYFNCLMLPYFWNSFHRAHWSNVNFYSRF